MQQHQDSKTISFDQIFTETKTEARKTKIICTLGPACWDTEMLVKMLDAGLDIARLNFSHGDHETHGRSVANLREALKQRPGKSCAIMLDTKGPEIRTGMLKDHKPIELVKDQELIISTDYTLEGDNTKIACSYESLCTSVKVGQDVLVADGSLTCEVKEIMADSIKVICKNGCKLGERKNMNLPGVIVDLPTLTAKDEKDLVEFGVKQNVDFIAASFVRKASDLDYIRKVLGEDGKHIKIISKIENQEGLQNYDAILESSDGIMVARGDLGMEIPPQKVFLAQKWMIEKANLAAKPVVTATQMLESMIKAPRPTRAEAGDVANAVLDGTDCVMLSGESANGDYPINAVTIMAKISVEAEQNYNNARHQREMNEMTKSCSLTESMCQSVVHMAETQNADAIICCTDTGLVPRLVAKYRPTADILALSASETVVRQFKQQRGVKGLHCQPTKTNLEIIKFAIQQGMAQGLISGKKFAVLVKGEDDETLEKVTGACIFEM